MMWKLKCREEMSLELLKEHFTYTPTSGGIRENKEIR